MINSQSILSVKFILIKQGVTYPLVRASNHFFYLTRNTSSSDSDLEVFQRHYQSYNPLALGQRMTIDGIDDSHFREFTRMEKTQFLILHASLDFPETFYFKFQNMSIDTKICLFVCLLRLSAAHTISRISIQMGYDRSLISLMINKTCPFILALVLDFRVFLLFCYRSRPLSCEVFLWL